MSFCFTGACNIPYSVCLLHHGVGNRKLAMQEMRFGSLRKSVPFSANNWGVHVPTSSGDVDDVDDVDVDIIYMMINK